MFDFITRVSTKGRSSIFQDTGQFLRQFAGRRAGSAGGERVYAGSYRQGAAETTHTGAFKASAGQRKGPIRVEDFYTSFEWWKTEPHDELVNNGAYCLAKPGEIYAVYLPKEGTVTVKLEPGAYEASWFSAFTGEKIPLPPVRGPEWTSPKSPGWLDWAILIRKRQAQ